ncbi:hypothetical protein H6P87_00415 [Rickettsia tillamookensis]|uniref:F5/8 type C domain-containing protein n=1 Tax=Rickettsia tillamookensis TaxID=2761623 RepID=A0A9E6MHQ9_9RICK|nr:hypothetical protein [Rickettsia tillamookensis]QQV74873.1 hypothetical protein H6P87_00415 [Rickettsia tillamookensis]
MPAANILSGFEKTIKTEVKCVILDLPFNVVEGNDQPYLAFYLQSNVNEALYVSTDGRDYTKIANLTNQTFIGSVISFTSNSLTINYKNFETLVNDD